LIANSMADQGTPTRNLRLTPAPGARPDNEDQLSTELDAIITIGRALSQIPDAETRARVMRWAVERFGIDMTPAAEPEGDLELPSNVLPSAAAQAELPSESLNLDGLGELFPADESPSAGAQEFENPRSRERKRPRTTAGDRLRNALHWMGI